MVGSNSTPTDEAADPILNGTELILADSLLRADLAAPSLQSQLHTGARTAQGDNPHA